VYHLEAQEIPMPRRARLVAVAVFAIVVASCSSPAPTTPSPAVPGAPASLEGPFNGVWTLTGAVTKCLGLRHCFAQIDQPVALTMRLVHVGDLVEGTIIAGQKMFDVLGTVKNGELRVTGQQTPGAGCVGAANLGEFVLSPDGAGWTGRYNWTSVEPATCNEPYYQVLQEVRLLTASRVTPHSAVSEFTGGWEGSTTTEACSPTDVVKACYHYPVCDEQNYRPFTVVCEAGTKQTFGVGMTQQGTQVTGTLKGVPVSGTVVNGRVTLSGTRTYVHQSLEPGIHVHTIADATLSIDHIGRMSGTYRLEREYVPASGQPAVRWSQVERLDQVVMR